MQLTNDFGESRMREIRMSGLMRERERSGHWPGGLSFRASLSTLLKGKRDSARPIHQCYSRNPRLSSFRREGGDDFFEAWTAAGANPIRDQVLGFGEWKKSIAFRSVI